MLNRSWPHPPEYHTDRLSVVTMRDLDTRSGDLPPVLHTGLPPRILPPSSRGYEGHGLVPDSRGHQSFLRTLGGGAIVQGCFDTPNRPVVRLPRRGTCERVGV